MKMTLLKSISLVAFLAVSTPVFAEDAVVATVDGQKFTYSQVMEAKAALPKEYQALPEDKLFAMLVNEAVDSYLINKAAQASGEAQKPEVKKAIEKATEGIIAKAYLFDKIKPIVTDAAVQAKYDEWLKSLPQEKEVHLRQILVDNKEVAQSIIKALRNGGDFKKLATAKSTDQTAKEGGDLGFLHKDQLPKDLADAAFALTPGSYSQEPIKTDFGWHVLKVEEFRDAKPPKFDEVKNEFKAAVTQDALITVLKDLRAQAKVELFTKDGKPLPLEAEKKPAEAAPTTGEAKAPAAATETSASATAPAAEEPAKK